MRLLQAITCSSSSLDAPVSRALRAHGHAAIGAESLSRIRADAERHGPMEPIVSIPAVLDRGVHGRDDARVIEERAGLQRTAGWRATPFAASSLEGSTELRSYHRQRCVTCDGLARRSGASRGGGCVRCGPPAEVRGGASALARGLASGDFWTRGFSYCGGGASAPPVDCDLVATSQIATRANTTAAATTTRPTFLRDAADSGVTRVGRLKSGPTAIGSGATGAVASGATGAVGSGATAAGLRLRHAGSPWLRRPAPAAL